MFTRKPLLQPEKFAVDGAKRLLQHNRHKAAQPMRLACPQPAEADVPAFGRHSGFGLDRHCQDATINSIRYPAGQGD
jgi:hypothetical protein